MNAIPNDMEFGALPRTKTCYGDGTFPRHEDVPEMKLLPRRVWQPVSMNRHVPMIYGQLDGMCTANGACSAMMTGRSIRGRTQNPVLSPENLYTQVAKWNEGSSLDEILLAMVNVGVCTRKAISQEDWRERDWPKDWIQRAGWNRMHEFVDLNADFDAVATALQRHRPCLIGVNWPGGGGHAIEVTQLIHDGRGWAVRGPNSWGESWGDRPGYSAGEMAWLKVHKRRVLTGGFYTLTERECGDFRQFGCWAVGSST